MIPLAISDTAKLLDWWPHVTLGALLLVGAGGILAAQRMGLSWKLAIGGVRTVVQLAAVGYVLKYVFAANAWYWVVLALLVMASVASLTATNQQSDRRYKRWLFGPITLGIFLSSAVTLVLVTEVVVRVDTWYDPQYLIPLGGMIAGNAMNAATLAGDRLSGNLANMRGRVEAALALGASTRQAARPAVRSAVRAALIPTINTLMVVGLVKLPGMMTGQIIGGEEPLTAAKYQVVVMFMIMLADAAAASITVQLGLRNFFTDAAQLRPLASNGNGE